MIQIIIIDERIVKKKEKKIDKAHTHTYPRKYRSKLVNDLNIFYHERKSKNIKDEIHRNIQKRNTGQNINQLKRLMRLNRSTLVKKENISQKELDKGY